MYWCVLVKIGWDVENLREVRAFGVLFVFWGIWEGVRNRKGCVCVWGFGVFEQRIRKRRDVDVFGGMECVGG